MFRSLLELLGLVEEVEDDEDFPEVNENEMEERRQRMFRPAPPSASVIICRGMNCSDNMEQLAEELRKGKVLIADLREIEREPGQTFLDFICGVAHGAHGFVSRIAPGIFIAATRRSMVEEWESPVEEEEVDDIEGTHYRS